jgi:hypothetical protein
VAPDFLPPDPHADLPEPPRAAFEPPAPAARRGSRIRLSLALGAGSIGAAALTYGALFVVTLPAAIAALVLGLGGRRAEPRPQYADAAMIIAVVATVVSLLATVLWIVALANGDSPFDDGGAANGNGDLSFAFVRTLAAAR